MAATSPFYVLAITCPAFIVIILGYISVKFFWLTQPKVQGLVWFVMRIALPTAIFQALSSQSFHEIMNIGYIVVYAGGSLIVFFLMFSLTRMLQKRPLAEAAITGLGSSMSNTMLIGSPVVISLFGPAALIPLALTLMVENLLILPLSLTLADTDKQKHPYFPVVLIRSIYQLTKNPIILAIAMGTLCSSFSISQPAILNKVMDSLASTISGLAQFTIGAILAGTTLNLVSPRLNSGIGLIIIGKLLIHPTAIILMMLAVPSLDPMFASVAIVLACMPMFSIFAVLGIDYELGEFCSTALLTTTLISFITINLTIWLLDIQHGLN